MNEKLIEKTREGLRHCAPAGDEKGGCAGCPYYEPSCKREDREMVALPNAMVEDFRNMLAAYVPDGNG